MSGLAGAGAGNKGNEHQQLADEHRRLTAALEALGLALIGIEPGDALHAHQLYYWPLRRMAENVESMLRTARRFAPEPAAAPPAPE